ncbi:LysE family translocator [Jannaschia sp. S6380]|uniref:LysE family translocator n=1 Tax=Jannaschia sp. S6380 TaxID=2926408 RepID=UPI001FF65C6A|nr:LysE family translocator [Jannaschia sp. S6380]MCK0167896.1 LysE family translocator [Jannaschia sp. S6380]
MIQTTLALLLFLAPLAYSPGPGNLFFAATGARFGFAATWPALAGYHVATWIVTLAIGLGLAAALRDHPEGMRAMRVAGAAYVLWLAWRIASAGPLDETGDAARAGWISGAVLLILNPKAYVIIALMFSQFLSRFPLDPTATVVLVTTIFTLNNLVAFALWSLLGDRLAARFRSERGARGLNLTFGALLAGVAVWMLLA